MQTVSVVVVHFPEALTCLCNRVRPDDWIVDFMFASGKVFVAVDTGIETVMAARVVGSGTTPLLSDDLLMISGSGSGADWVVTNSS